MSLINRLRDFILGEAPPALRNRAGGLAMIRRLANPDSSGLNGHIVTTVSADAEGYWVIDPPQPFVAKMNWITVTGQKVAPGDHVAMVELHDVHLLPLKDPGADERTEERSFQPPLPLKAKENA